MHALMAPLRRLHRPIAALAARTRLNCSNDCLLVVGSMNPSAAALQAVPAKLSRYGLSQVINGLLELGRFGAVTHTASLAVCA